ncbi:hypothetical protein A5662_22630 [Mycobacteriaceae bacterium 1482268.1]|nr:hypothetical protein A5662_22630 [Mycobacteriaceae bacterium 1482268.1]
MLVHGAWHDTWCWERVIPELRRRGHEVTAVSLPKGRVAGTQAYAAAIDEAISSPAETTVVAHSAGGLVAPLVAGKRGVRELVLVAALMALPGFSWMGQRAAENSAQHTESFLSLEPRVIADDEGNWTMPPDCAVRLFYNDCEPADAESAVRRMRTQETAVFTEAAPVEPPAAVPTRYVLCTRDQALSRDWAIRTARERFDAIVEEFDASHSPFWSRPADLAELLTRSGLGTSSDTAT